MMELCVHCITRLKMINYLLSIYRVPSCIHKMNQKGLKKKIGGLGLKRVRIRMKWDKDIRWVLQR